MKMIASEADSYPAGRLNRRYLLKTEGCSLCPQEQLDYILGLLNTVQTLTHSFLNIRFNIILPSVSI